MAAGSTAGSGAPDTRPRVTILPLLSVNFIGTLGYSIAMPLMVFLVIEFGGNGFVLGVIGATYSVFQLLGAPLLGRYSDIHGRKPILLLSQVGTLAAWLLVLLALMLPGVSLVAIDSSWFGEFTLTLPLLILFLGRALDGVTGASISVANAYLVDVSSTAERKTNCCRIAASSNLGFIVGPLLAGLLGATALGEIAPVAAATLISLLAVIVVIRMLPAAEPQRLEATPCVDQRVRRVLGKEIKDCFDGRPSSTSLARVLRIRSMPLMLLLYGLLFLVFNVFYIAFPIHAATGLDWEIGQLGIFFSVLSLAMIAVQGPVMAWLSPRAAEKPLVAAGSLAMCASFLLLQFAATPAVYAAALLFALGNGVVWPSFLSLLVRLGEAGDQGYIQGVASSAGSFASIVGLVAGGLLYGWLGAASFVLAAGIFLLAGVLALGIPGRPGETPAAAANLS